MNCQSLLAVKPGQSRGPLKEISNNIGAFCSNFQTVEQLQSKSHVIKLLLTSQSDTAACKHGESDRTVKQFAVHMLIY